MPPQTPHGSLIKSINMGLYPQGSVTMGLPCWNEHGRWRLIRLSGAWRAPETKAEKATLQSVQNSKTFVAPEKKAPEYGADTGS